MESISNFRELGNLPVARGAIGTGLLFRSGHLANMSDRDERRLGELGIRTVVDLRNDGDIASEGQDRIPGGVVHHRAPIHDDAGRGGDIRDMIMRNDLDELRAEMGDGRAHQIALDGGIAFVQNPDRVASFAGAMEVIVDPDNWPVLWHCSAGKDRAGWVATAVLIAADASTEVIVDHYVQSNATSDTAERFPEGELKDLIRPFLEVHEDYVRAQLGAVREHWGGAEGLYRDGFGLPADALERFRAALIDQGAR